LDGPAMLPDEYVTVLADVMQRVPAFGCDSVEARTFELCGIVGYHVYDRKDWRLRSWPVC